MSPIAELRARLALPPTSRRFVGRETAVAALQAVLDLGQPATVTAVAAVLGTRTTARRGTTNRDVRGNSKNRAARRQWLVNVYGNGEKVLCYRCREPLTVDTVTSDRIVPGVAGGTYRRENIRPACLGCNASTGARLRAGHTVQDLPVPLARLLAAVRCHPDQVRIYPTRYTTSVHELAARGLVTVERGALGLIVRPALGVAA